MQKLFPVARIVLFFAVAVFAAQIWLQNVAHTTPTAYTGPYYYAIATFSSLVEGTGHRPFVARMFFPAYVKGLSLVVPAPALKTLALGLDALGFAPYFYPESSVTPSHLIVWYILILLSLTLFAEGMYRFLSWCFTGPRWLLIIFSILPVLVWSKMFAYISYTYDPFSPMLAVWTLYLGLRRRWPAFFALLCVATVHKETTVTLPLAIAYGIYLRDKKISWKMGLAVPAAIVVIRFVLTKALFPFSLGSSLEFHLFDHNLIPETMGYIYKMFIAALFLPFVFYQWPKKSAEIRAALVPLAPLLVMGWFFGFFDEIRQYAEALPGFTLCLVGSLAIFTKGRWIEMVAKPPLAAPECTSNKCWMIAAAATILLITPVIVVRKMNPTQTRTPVIRQLADLQNSVPSGTAWNAPSNLILATSEFLRAETNAVNMSSVAISVDCNDIYRLTVRRGAESWSQVIGPYPESCPGMIESNAVFSDKPIIGVEEITVVPISGDERYAIGHLKIL